MHSNKIPIKLKNIRDLGYLKTKDDFYIKPKSLIRSPCLFNISKKDLQYLYDEYNLRNVFDLRNHNERIEKPDLLLEGICYFHNPVQKSEDIGLSKDEDSIRKLKEYFDNLRKILNGDYNAVIKHMSNFYRSLASEYTIKTYIKLIKDIYQNKGTSLYHCSLGKDRAGILSVMIEEILGVDKQDIYDDYLYTNKCLDIDFPLKDINSYMEVAMKEYLDAYYDEIIKKYGNYYHYLNVYGIDDNFINNFRNKYLVK